MFFFFFCFIFVLLCLPLSLSVSLHPTLLQIELCFFFLFRSLSLSLSLSFFVPLSPYSSILSMPFLLLSLCLFLCTCFLLSHVSFSSSSSSLLLSRFVVFLCTLPSYHLRQCFFSLPSSLSLSFSILLHCALLLFEPYYSLSFSLYLFLFIPVLLSLPLSLSLLFKPILPMQTMLQL